MLMLLHIHNISFQVVCQFSTPWLSLTTMTNGSVSWI